MAVGRLLYICDHLPNPDTHVLHLTFEATRTKQQDISLRARPAADTTPIRDVRFVPLHDLTAHGFTPTFQNLALAGFPTAGTYPGPKSAIGL